MAALTREAGAAMTVRTYWAWETTATLRLLGGARDAGAPTGGGEGRGISCRHAHSLLTLTFTLSSSFQTLSILTRLHRLLPNSAR